MVGIAYRAVRYSALASVAIGNAPMHSRDLAGKIEQLFDIMFTASALNGYLRIGGGAQFYNMLACAGDTQYYFSLKPEFYACLQKAITRDTGKPPVEGVAWLAMRYTSSRKQVITPITVFEKAARRFNRQNSKTKRHARI